MNWAKTLGAVSTALLAACGAGDAGVSTADSATVEVRTMGAGDMVLDADAFDGVPERVQVVGDRMLIVDNMAPLKLVVADTSGRVAFRAVPTGDGPGEARVIRNVGVFRDTIHAWSSGRQQLLLRPFEEDTVVPRRALTQAGEPRFGLPDFDGTTILVGVMGDYMYARSVGDSAYPVGSAPKLILESSPDAMTRFGWSYVGGVARHPFLRMLAIGYRDAGQMTIVKLDNGKELYSHRPKAWDLPEARVDERGQPVLGAGLDGPLGFIDVAADSLYVLGLFADRAERDISFDLPPIGNDVYVYDWQAQLLRVLRFDLPISSVAYDDGQLYAIEWDSGVPAVKRWALELPTAAMACPPWDPLFPTSEVPSSAGPRPRVQSPRSSRFKRSRFSTSALSWKRPVCLLRIRVSMSTNGTSTPSMTTRSAFGAASAYRTLHARVRRSTRGSSPMTVMGFATISAGSSSRETPQVSSSSACRARPALSTVGSMRTSMSLVARTTPW